MPTITADDTAKSSVLDLYRERIDSFVSESLSPYVARLADSDVRGIGSKELNDPVCGTIALSPLEVIVLDSPLLQRLRRIRQLGVAQYVYPGANHTRLEHSIGVCHQVQRLITSLELHTQGQALTPEWADTLRLAALCHDVGHGLMSHVVENALRFDRTSRDLILEFQDRVDKDTESQLSEIAAYYMLRSPAFGSLLAEARRISGLNADPTMNERMADLVVGLSQDQAFPLIHEAISGPFDCDKLDYMTRDAMMCGVPIVTDVTRLIQKVRAVEVRTDRLPSAIQQIVEDRGGSHTIVAVSRSGASTLHEVSLARSLMHDKVYRHHKVRATEAMVAAIIAKIGRVLDMTPPLIPLAIEDDAFIALDDPSLRSVEQRAGDALSDESRSIAVDLAQRLRERRLFVRAFAFSQKMPFDAYRKDSEQRAAIENLIRDADEGDQRREIVGQIAQQVRKMIDLLGTEIPESIDQDLEAYIWLDPPVVKRKNEHDSDQNRAYLVDHGDELVQMAEVSAETRGWADAYINTRDVGYVFCPAEIAPFVHIATETVLRVERGITIPREMHSYAKVSSPATENLRAHLLSLGHYEGLPRDLRPLAGFMRKSGTATRLSEAATRLAQYMGPNPKKKENKAEGGALNPRKIADWVAQFEDDYLDLALRLVEGTMLLDRDATVAALETFLEDDANAVFRDATLVPLGEPKDGSAILTYYGADVNGMKVRSLADALLHEGPLLFIDDIIQQGSSAISIFENLLGLEPTTNLNEERGQPLGAAAKEALLGREIALVTSAGMSTGIGRVQTVLRDYGLKISVYAHRTDNDLPTVHSVLASSPAKTVDAFVNRLGAVGADLMTGKTEAPQRRLGYGNQGLLVISAFNTPTMTLTALWKDGQVGGASWRPLFPRRGKR